MLKLRDIMTRDVITLDSDLSVRDAMALLASRHVSGAPVVSGANVIGVISGTDLLDFASSLPGIPIEQPEEPAAEWGEGEPDEADTQLPAGAYFTELWSESAADLEERFTQTAAPEWNALAEHTVSEAMSRDICALPSSTDVHSAADFMRRAGIHRLLVIDDGRLAGIVSTMDITRAVADRKLTRRTYVFNRDRQFDDRA
jgi:CBS domain-containing protein